MADKGHIENPDTPQFGSLEEKSCVAISVRVAPSRAGYINGCMGQKLLTVLS